MKTIYIKIDGMTCDHCKVIITKLLEKNKCVKNVVFDGHIAEVEYNGKLDKRAIIDSIIEVDYYTDFKMISENKESLRRTMSMAELIKILAFLILLAFILNNLFKINIFNIIPVIDSKITLAMLFLTGIFTSIHCISMCGAINLIASTSSTRNFKKPILYNLGRLTSYTIVGGVVGLIGNIFKINVYMQGTIIIIAAVFMFMMALNMMGIINFSLSFKKPKMLGFLNKKGSFMIGIFNGLMPCGPLQSMQLYALSTGSIIFGALSMFIFCLGTIPLMLFVGIISNFLNNKNRKILNKMSTVLILILSIIMLNRGLLGMGIDISNTFKPSYDNYMKAEIKGNYQIIEFDLSYNGYKDLVVKKDIPVKIIINVTNKTLTGCNNSIKINGFNISKDLRVGQNIIEFTPTKIGTFTYTCWMGMLKNKILVIDD